MRSFHYVIFAYLQQLCVAKDSLPLFLMDYDKIMENLVVDTNPFARTDTNIFGPIIERAMKMSSIILIFVEDQFCTEDVSGKDKSGTPYVNLRAGLLKEKVKYFPNVVNPIGVLARLMPPSEGNAFKLKKGEPMQIPEGLPFYYIFFDDYDEGTRVEALRRHDAFMHDIVEETRRISSSAVAIYTGRNNPIVLTKYESDQDGGASAVKQPSNEAHRGVLLASDGALFHFVDLSIEMAPRARRTDFEYLPVVASESRSFPSQETEYLRTNIEYQGLQIKFSFRLTEDFWTLDNVTLMDGGEDMGTTIIGVRVPIGRSYYCNEPLIIPNENDKSYVSIPEYRIQPFRSVRSDDIIHFQDASPPAPPASASTNGTFGAADKCNPYFDIPILTGLCITGILLSILLVGISFLFNCATNSHYDDPLAKTLVISATD